MATINDLLTTKGSQVYTTGPDASVLQAVLLMNDNKVGALVVTKGDEVIGMFTERDLLRRVVGEQRNPNTTRVSEVMTAEVVCCTPQTSLEEARGAMKNRRIRHLPVIEDGRLCGLISIGDLNAHQINTQEHTIHLMHEYLYGRS
jgi:CBS domain-containing protein